MDALSIHANSRETLANVNQVAAARRAKCDAAQMSLWITFVVVLLLVVMARADSRDRSNRPMRSWNIWFGLNPKEGESRARYTLRRALAALVTVVVLSIPLLFVSAAPDEGARFSGNESVVEMAVFMIFAPLTAMAFGTLVALLFSSVASAVFRRRHVFNGAAGEFVRR